MDRIIEIKAKKIDPKKKALEDLKRKKLLHEQAIRHWQRELEKVNREIERITNGE